MSVEDKLAEMREHCDRAIATDCPYAYEYDPCEERENIEADMPALLAAVEEILKTLDDASARAVTSGVEAIAQGAIMATGETVRAIIARNLEGK